MRKYYTAHYRIVSYDWDEERLANEQEKADDEALAQVQVQQFYYMVIADNPDEWDVDVEAPEVRISVPAAAPAAARDK